MTDQTSPTDMVGRDAEVAQLVDLALQATTGRGEVVLVEGEPGIGKTRLLDVAAAEFVRLGVQVMRGAAEELERRFPYAAIDSCLGTRFSATAPQGEAAVMDAAVNLVRQRCAAGPVALVVDDVQWADTSSLLVLDRLGRLTGQLPLLLVMAANRLPHGLAGPVDRGARSLPLRPLDPPAVAQLVEGLLGATPAPRLLELVAGASGNPLYVIEAVASLSRDGAPAGAGTTGTGRNATILRRLGFLPPRVRQLLRVAGLLGERFSVTELAAVLDWPAGEVAAAADDAVAVGVLLGAGGQLAFRHTLIRAALVEEIHESARPALHLHIGQALAAAGARVERVAEHLLAGATHGGPAVHWLADHAEPLIARSPELAADLLRRLLELAHPADPRRPELTVQLAEALSASTRADQAELLLREMLVQDATTGGDAGGQQATTRLLVARACAQQHRLAQAAAEAEMALAAASATPGETARAHCFLARCLFLMGREQEAEDAANRGLAAATRAADPHGASAALATLACIRYFQLRTTDALELADRAAAVRGPDAPADLPSDALLVQAGCLLESGRLDEAEQALDGWLRRSRQQDDLLLGWYHLTRGHLRYLVGRWDDAVIEFQAGLESGGSRYLGLADALRAMVALIASHRGERRTPPTRPTGDAVPSPADHAPRLGQVLALEMRGAAGQPAEVLRAAGHHADPESLLHAADAYQRLGCPLYQAYALESAAVLLAEDGQIGTARTVFKTALARYRELGASWQVSRAQARLRPLGIRCGTGEQRGAGLGCGWDALTTTERTVAAFVVEGLTNPNIGARLFVSPRTIQTHVSNILHKLGLGSRVEVAVAAAGRSPAWC